ncbi:acetoin utilization AcuB family protein [Heyndrickxia oleronia]|jgi:acetoin utilization protein AcuB|uniref:Acetoin utilization AcuB family protein n=1 Tax=Heyndrickxia oleronia TaxID=38875 RepID=A0A8E2I6R0_9BACI|nr:acetoin utilization AcuB family protein [Heyndrickxia oleronia]NYV64296.1 CBS domain-containing protein [Bacillus sp. Gen3]OJH17373.1 acetoin utilization protein AcuB [Bacillus obstructivus]MCM3237299.1 acetoin utilization AcuB family protein [Heyndrickxia oleronia]MCM3456003.1 acetoin utilization AcuB family protein [Heyndrickxia oleronia]MDH5160499.1 acetoin utilization AcuB family protein [Heyndrickxia oleronia]
MIIEEIMKTDVITLQPEDTIHSALLIMREKKIRHIPIVDSEQHLLGLVTERDIKDATPSPLFEKKRLEKELTIPLEQIMNPNVITGHPLDFVEEVAGILYEHRIGCLPIVVNKKVVGIITGTDILRTMVELTGANQPGSQIEIKVRNRTGVLHEVTGIFNQYHVNVHSVLVYPDKKDPNHKILVFRIQTMNPIIVIEHLKKNGYQVLWPNMPGMSL